MLNSLSRSLKSTSSFINCLKSKRQSFNSVQKLLQFWYISQFTFDYLSLIQLIPISSDAPILCFLIVRITRTDIIHYNMKHIYKLQTFVIQRGAILQSLFLLVLSLSKHLQYPIQNKKNKVYKVILSVQKKIKWKNYYICAWGKFYKVFQDHISFWTLI